MKYECKMCKFGTNNLYDFTRHEGSGKHKNNKAKSERLSDVRKKSAQDKKDRSSDTDTNHMLIGLVDKISDMCKMQIEVLKSQADASNKSMSAIKYLAKHRTTAPPIAPLKGRELTKMIEYKGNKSYKLADIIIHNYKHRTLAGFLGDMIVDKYKTDEPEDQSVWMSDLARLSFIIRELKDGNPEWVKDKSGTKLAKLIISPLMKKVKEMLIERVNELDEINNESETDEMDARDNVQTMQQINEIIRDINLSKFDGAILKHIAPEFNLEI
jgi:hypothetical protein